MAVEQKKKRARPEPKNGEKSKKRQKTITTDGPAIPRAKKGVAIDSLPWSEVAVPEMYDDAEGFYGLEEVDDVEVVRQGQTIQFISKSVQAEVGNEEEFKGFSDDEPSQDQPTKPESSSVDPLKAVSEKQKKKKEKKEKKKKSKESTKTGDGLEEMKEDLAGNIFAALEEDAEQEEVDVSAWADLDLSSRTLSALSKMGFSTPTSIQAAAIPEILAGHDVVGKASTGSGKTLAFGIPILEKWLEDRGEKVEEEPSKDNSQKIPIALILSPTRELAHQLSAHMIALCKHLPTSPRVAAVTGGMSVEKQRRQLTKADIIVGTPGRLWEVFSTSIELMEAVKQIHCLVIDEADRLLTDGHFKEVEQILSALDRQVREDGDDDELASKHQTLVFSATFHKGLQHKLAGKGKNGLMDKAESMEYLLKKLNFREDRPKFVDVNPISQMAEGLKEGLVECAGLEKDLYLYSVLLYHRNQRILIFTNSIHSVRRITPFLQNLGLPAQALHSQMVQKQRMRSIEKFSAAKSTGSILVATDVAARGLDISGVQLVLHYHLPRTADMYVHRSGRTARASATGSSILLCAPEEVVGMRRLVAKVHAQNAIAGGDKKSKYYMRSLDIDRKVVARLKPRVTLAKQIADSALAKEKKHHDDDWVKNAAEELGVDYDSEEFEAAGGGRKGRGTGRKLKEKQARALSKAELGALKAELKTLLSQRVNVGVSERYLTSGPVDVDELLKGAAGDFLGKVDGIGFDE